MISKRNLVQLMISLILITFIVMTLADMYWYHTHVDSDTTTQQVLYYNRFTQPYTLFRIRSCQPAIAYRLPEQGTMMILTIRVNNCNDGKTSFRTILDRIPIPEQ